MKLFEFFGNINHDPNQEDKRDPQSPSKEEEQELCDNVFWFILDDDELHKKHFMPIAKELKAKYANTADDASHDWKSWIPMVNSGCMKYYKENKIEKNPSKTFSKDFRKDLCKRLEDHYRESIEKAAK
jgi:hypothetical protein